MSTAAGQTPRSSSSSSSSASNSISLVQVDELSSFGATKQNRLPALIKLNPLADSQQQQQQQAATSMPGFSASEVEKMAVTPNPQAESMPAQLSPSADKENVAASRQQQQPKSLNATESSSDKQQRTLNDSDDFQVVNMDEEEGAVGSEADLIGPSLPAPNTTSAAETEKPKPEVSANFTSTSFAGEWDAKSLSAQLQSSHLGDSLIEMIINLRNENQNLVRALETNNDYVKERLQEFKRAQEEAKRRESQYALEKAELEHQARKLRRQNDVLSERLKSLESKLKELNSEVGQSLEAAHSSKASSVRANNNELYPELAAGDESFGNSALASRQPTMQMDATSGELYNQGDAPPGSGSSSDDMEGVHEQQPRAGPSHEEAARRVGVMSKEELSEHFDAAKAQFYALDDPMKQCDQLEKQLNDIGRRDYEICLLQQQLNIYRQDFRLERMAKLEAKIQIEKLKADIDRLCLERVQEQQREANLHFGPTTTMHSNQQQQQQQSDMGAGVHLIGKLGHHLGKKAVRSAAKAAKYAAKQAHLEEKAAAALARAQAARATAASLHGTTPKAAGAETPAASQQQAAESAGTAEHYQQHQHHHHRGHHRHSSGGGAGPGRPHRASTSGRGGIRSEVVNDLLSTANKAMLTGYKMASTHVNLALDKLSQFEQQQAAQLDPNKRPPIQQHQPAAGGKSAAPSAPPMEPPSID